MPRDVSIPDASQAELSDEKLDPVESGNGSASVTGLKGLGDAISHASAGSGKVKFEYLTIKKYADWPP